MVEGMDHREREPDTHEPAGRISGDRNTGVHGRQLADKEDSGRRRHSAEPWDSRRHRTSSDILQRHTLLEFTVRFSLGTT